MNIALRENLAIAKIAFKVKITRQNCLAGENDASPAFAFFIQIRLHIAQAARVFC